MLSRTGGYALHAALAIAERGQDGRPVRAVEIAEALDIPGTYLAKILHALARDGVLTSERGRHGGFRLARAPEEITLLDVVGGFDDVGAERECLLGGRPCSEANDCPVHDAWREASAPAFRFFQSRTLADLLRDRA